jgi:hypothetical protein
MIPQQTNVTLRMALSVSLHGSRSVRHSSVERQDVNVRVVCGQGNTVVMFCGGLICLWDCSAMLA